MTVVKGAGDYEKGALNAVIEARAKAQSAQGLPARESAERDLGAALGKLFALSEAYPQLQATQGYLDLQKQLGALEDELQSARRYYNAVVRDHNSFGQSFPNLVIAPAAGFKAKSYFLADEGERQVPSLG